MFCFLLFFYFFFVSPLTVELNTYGKAFSVIIVKTNPDIVLSMKYSSAQHPLTVIKKKKSQPCYSSMLIGAFRGVEDRVYRWIGGFRTSCFILPRFSWRLNAEASWSILILPNKTQLFLALSTPLLLLSVFVSSPTSCVTDTDKTVSYAWTFMRGTLHRLTQFMMNCLQL